MINTCLDISSQDIKKQSKGKAFASIVVGAFLTATSMPMVDIDKKTFFSMPRMESTIIKAEQIAVAPQKSIRERYKRIAKTQWFKDAYENRSIGETMTIEE